MSDKGDMKKDIVPQPSRAAGRHRGLPPRISQRLRSGPAARTSSFGELRGFVREFLPPHLLGCVPRFDSECRQGLLSGGRFRLAFLHKSRLR
jgi:hypothetical protein